MIAVSNAFKAAVKATTRRASGRLEIVWTDALIDRSISASSNDTNYVDRTSQAADGVKGTSRKWAHLDGQFKADGTWFPMPGVNEIATQQMGWYGATACNASCLWSAPYPTLTIRFDARAVITLNVIGDTVYNEYPVDFDVLVYRDPDSGETGDQLIYTENVIGNILLDWSKSIYGLSPDLYRGSRMDLVIKKWSTPNRVAKIVEFYSSITETYEGDDIVSIDLLEEREINDGTLPIGNISANELDIDLQNIRLIKEGDQIPNPFSPSNDQSYLTEHLIKNRKITGWIGLVLPSGLTEWVQIGKFWSGDWKSSEKGTTVSTSARDRMELLRNAKFSRSAIYTNITLYDLMIAVLTSAKFDIPMLDLTWAIDTELQNYTVPIAFFPVQDYFKCIRQIVEACMGQAYMNRQDVLIITGPSFAGNTTGYQITADDYFDRSQPAKSEDIKNVVNVPISALTEQDDESAVYTTDENEPITIPAGQTITVNADYTSYPAINPSCVLTQTGSDIVIDNDASEFFACSANVVLKNNGAAEKTCSLVINATAYDVKSDTRVSVSDPDSIITNGKQEYDFPANHLLQTRAMGQLINAKLLATYKTLRKDTNLTWRGDPSLELGDKIVAPEYRHGATVRTGNFYIYKNQLKFDGTLKAITDGRKVA